MPFSVLLTTSGVLGLVFGLGFFFAPDRTLAVYAASTGPVGYLLTQFFGAALFQIGVVYILIRDLKDPVMMRRIAIGSALGSLAGLRVAVYAVRNEMVNSLGWSTVAIYGLLALGYGWYAYKLRQATN